MRTIAFFSHTSGLGGAELALWELARELARRGHRVHTVAPEEGPLLERMRASGVLTDVVNYQRWTSHGGGTRRKLRRWSRNLRSVGSVAALLARISPAAVVTNTLTIPVPALAARRCDLPHLWYVHEFGARDHGLRFDLGYGPTLRLIDRLSRTVLVNSQAVLEEVTRFVPAEKVRRLTYAVDVPAGEVCPPRACAAFRLALVGRLMPSKGQREAIEAVARLREKGRDVTLSLVGSQQADFAGELQALCVQRGVHEAVRFAGESASPLSFFRNADAALMCSRAEAFGRVTIEAMKVDRPVIGARSGATIELVREGETGLLYEPGNPADLAEKIEMLCRDRALARRLGRQAGEWARRSFTSGRFADAFLAALDDAGAAGSGVVR